MAKFNSNELNRKIREAQRKAQQQVKREVDRVNRANKKIIDDHNRKVDAHNRKVVSDHNRSVRQQNQKADAHNRKVIADLNRQLRTASSPVRYSEPERQLADKVHEAVASLDPREYDSFLSYARIDGAEIASQLRDELESLGVAVWFDEVAIIPGRSQSLQMDAGLRKARSGITVLTPAYLTGRFWTERELGALLNKSTLIPVLHNVTFDDVKQYSGILPDLAGFTTQHDSVEDIAKKIAAAVLVEDVG
ncbi:MULTISPECIES: toll/interleukin-1 receptor domain-containing protein [Halomonadaceae]|uniref:toll/interleukin-1 receptor domain-containing protein n=1 Tax=Halomonadaceae TaxID=28256 RepID=UPI001583BD16|nr:MULTISPECIES: toll/interleukin-1 receptor domain-containing protein [Halomonas]MDI4638547.1 toll/interleukin-1 receptor domain-containing protein [Halomonas sp. BMC7]NUJ59533.1 toll/interleukin-1 receptor domain-containing protein [Halomonas taeanensis]